MAVVRSGAETIVRHSRGLIAVYYVLVAGAGLIALLSLMVAFGEAVEAGPWTGKIYSVASWLIGAVMFAALAAQMYTSGKALSKSFVAIGPDGIRLQLPRLAGGEWAPGVERHFKWEEIRDITYQSNLRKRVCGFQAGNYIYTLTQNNSPSPRTIAKLLAEKKGVPFTEAKGAA